MARLSDTIRHDFEAFISSPPFERSVERFGDESAWPGNYVDLDVDLAWNAWQESASTYADKVSSTAPLPGEPDD